MPAEKNPLIPDESLMEIDTRQYLRPNMTLDALIKALPDVDVVREKRESVECSYILLTSLAFMVLLIFTALIMCLIISVLIGIAQLIS